MIPFTLRIVLIAAVLGYFIIIMVLLKDKNLQLKYTLLWLIAGFLMGIMVIVPKTLEWIRTLLGVKENMNALFLIAIAFLVMIDMSLTSIVSRQSDKIKNLIQESAKLEKRIRELEEHIK